MNYSESNAGTKGTTDHDSYPPSAQGWGAVGVLCVLYVLSLMDRNIMALLADAVGSELQLSDVELGLLYGAAFAIVYSIAGLPLGWAIDRFNRRVVIWAGVVCWSLSTVACGLSRNFAALFAARAGVGAGEAALVPGSQSILADMFPPDRLALPMSVYGLGAKIGGGLSFIIGGVLTVLFPVHQTFEILGLGTLKGWQLVFIAAGLPGLVISFAMFAIPEPARRRLSTPRASGKSTYGDYIRYMKENFRFFFGYHAGNIALLAVSNGISTWTPAFFSRVHGWSTDQIGSWLGLAMLIGPLIGIPIHGAVADHLFRRGKRDAHLYYFKRVLLASAVPAALAYVVESPWVALALITIAQSLLTGYIGLLSTSLQLMVPGDLRGKAASVALLIVGLAGMAFGPSLVGILTDRIFVDRSQVGSSLIVCIAVGLPLASALFGLAQKPMREHLKVI